MLQVQLIGNIGANAEIKSSDGREFVTFRVAHNETFTDAQGNKVEKSFWIDCTMACTNGRPAVFPYLTAGTMVYVTGSLTTRVYSSAKDRCMKAGLTVHVQKLELLGGQSDIVPKRLYTTDGVQVDVAKFYWCPEKGIELYDMRSKVYTVDKKGFITVKQDESNNNAEG